MRRTGKAIGTLAVATSLAMLGGGLAFADDVSNNVDNSVDATAEEMPLTVGGSNGTTQLRVIATNGDGKNGCNLTGGKTLTLDISSSNTAAATVSPSTVTFTSCSDTRTLTVSPVGQGESTISAAVSSNTTDGSFNLAPATFKAKVAAAAPVTPTNTPPVLSLPANISDVEGNTTGGATVAYTATASDTQDGTLTPVCSPTSGSVFTLGTTTVNCSVTDAGGLSDSGSFTINVVDTTKPTDVAFGSTGVQDGGSYLRGAVPAAPTCTASDVVDAEVACAVTGYSNAAGTHILTATATDDSGNAETATLSYTVRTLTLSGFLSPVDGNGVVNVVKGGSTVPLKFTVFDGTTERTDLAVVSRFVATKVGCAASAATDEVTELSANSGTSLRYSDTQFIQNWKTPTGAGTCYQVTLTTIDGSSMSALFKLK